MEYIYKVKGAMGLFYVKSRYMQVCELRDEKMAVFEFIV